MILATTAEQQQALTAAGWHQRAWGIDRRQGDYEVWQHKELPISFWVDTRGRFVLTPAAAYVLQEAANILHRTSPSPEIQPQALAVLDRWQKSMDNPETEPPLEVHHQDLEIIRQALTSTAAPSKEGGGPPDDR